jgi:hypothetical protein
MSRCSDGSSLPRASRWSCTPWSSANQNPFDAVPGLTSQDVQQSLRRLLFAHRKPDLARSSPPQETTTDYNSEQDGREAKEPQRNAPAHAPHISFHGAGATSYSARTCAGTVFHLRSIERSRSSSASKPQGNTLPPCGPSHAMPAWTWSFSTSDGLATAWSTSTTAAERDQAAASDSTSGSGLCSGA